jgi:hypothetical protein
MSLLWQKRRWEVRAMGTGGPGPNHWDARNVSIARNGDLTLKILKRGGLWTCAELFTQERLGFGTYDFDLIARPDRFVPQIVLGFFPYTRPDIGPDATNEIDIEFARWGDAKNPVGNFTVWPAVKEPGLAQTSQVFPMVLTGDYTSYRFVWTPTEIRFEAHHGHGNTGPLMASWRFAPPDPQRRMPQKPMPLHLNLWLFQGKAPADNRPVEVALRQIRYTP